MLSRWLDKKRLVQKRKKVKTSQTKLGSVEAEKYFCYPT